MSHIAIRTLRVCVQGVRVRPDTVDKEKNMTEPEPREELFSALGVTISPDLLIQALTHRFVLARTPRHIEL